MGKATAVVDERTATMSTLALKCRSNGHMMDDVDLPRAVRVDHFAKGERLVRWECQRKLRGQQCTYWREASTDLVNGEVIGAPKSGYGEEAASYLVQEKGTGRLLRASARLAYFDRVETPAGQPRRKPR